MELYAVIDTNVLVSALLCEGRGTPPDMIAQHIFNDRIKPVIHPMILREYEEVLTRKKFSFSQYKTDQLIGVFKKRGVPVDAIPYKHVLPDEKDRVFLEVALAARRKYGTAYLVTGNKKHFPEEPFILSPAELLAIMPAVR